MEEDLKELASQLRKPQGEKGLRVGEQMNIGNLMINRHTIALLKANTNNTILEIGMGNGNFVGELLAAYPDCTYTGCDYSADMVQASKNRNEEWILKGKATFVMGNANNLPFENNSFDRIFTINTVYFWDNPAKVLSECKRVLKPGGQLLIGIRPKEIMEKYLFVKYDFTLFSKEELCSMLQNNGFKIVDTPYFDEPDREMGGMVFKIATLIVIATPHND